MLETRGWAFIFWESWCPRCNDARSQDPKMFRETLHGHMLLGCQLAQPAQQVLLGEEAYMSQRHFLEAGAEHGEALRKREG